MHTVAVQIEEDFKARERVFTHVEDTVQVEVMELCATQRAQLHVAEVLARHPLASDQAERDGPESIEQRHSVGARRILDSHNVGQAIAIHISNGHTSDLRRRRETNFAHESGNGILENSDLSRRRIRKDNIIQTVAVQISDRQTVRCN